MLVLEKKISYLTPSEKRCSFVRICFPYFFFIIFCGIFSGIIHLSIYRSIHLSNGSLPIPTFCGGLFKWMSESENLPKKLIKKSQSTNQSHFTTLRCQCNSGITVFGAVSSPTVTCRLVDTLFTLLVTLVK